MCAYKFFDVLGKLLHISNIEVAKQQHNSQSIHNMMKQECILVAHKFFLTK